MIYLVSVCRVLALAAGVRRAVDAHYAHKLRSDSLRWITLNAALLLVFSLDLWYSCPGYRSALHYVEGALALAAAASAARHAARLLAGPPAPRADPAPRPARPDPAPAPAQLSPARSWRGEAQPAPASPPPAAPRAPPDTLIADRAQLERYLSAALHEEAGGAGAEGGALCPPPPAYQVSPLRAEPAPAARAAPGHAAGAGEPWRRVTVEPARLARFELNLRRWLHATVLARLARELDAADAELAAQGLEARVEAGAARLEPLAAAAPASLARRLRQLLPFLRPFGEPALAVARVRALARSACLSGYRWDGGGAGRECPADAELVVRLLAAYLDGACGGGFSAAHVSRAPAPPPRAPGSLALHGAALQPPHYVVAVGGEVLEPAPGRANLPAALLLFLLAAARREPPALLRTHLGPAGLNMLWMLELDH